MSVVGPRPALPNEVAAYNDYQRQRLLVKPGMTCYWQTRRNRDSITFDEWVDLDLWTGQGFLDGKISFFRQRLALGRTGRCSRSMSASSACCSRARCI
ncbi:sugar transferase [Senegalimassilia anaerobia]|uniref:sugar transferase n=1 Tax=Senegalimassilia anaerobia TaxID=1473216 RepID=UPI00345E9EFD